MLNCELLVVGAGPAGACAATAAAGAGISTMLIDAKMRIGEQPHCGEFVPDRLFVEHDLDKSVVIQHVSAMESIMMDSNDCVLEPGFKLNQWGLKSKIIASPGYMIDRVRFDRDLSRKAAASGAEVYCGARLTKRTQDGWVVNFGAKDHILNPKVIIAADGAGSSTTRSLGLTGPDLLKGIQIEAPLCNELDRTLIFLSKDIVGGYGWLFPKRKAANVGLGVIVGSAKPAIELLDDLSARLRDMKLIRSGVLGKWGGLIPVSGMRANLVIGNVILCGDAAGLTHPITGAGIPQAVFSGESAGIAAAAFIKTGDENFLRNYETDIKSRYSGVLRHAALKRKQMMNSWAAADFSLVCGNSWPAFKGYRKRIRDDAECC